MVRFLYLVPLFAAGLQAFASPVLHDGSLTVDEAYNVVTRLHEETHAVFSGIHTALHDGAVTDARGHAFVGRIQHSYDEAKRVLDGAKATSLAPSKDHNIKEVDKVGHAIINESQKFSQGLTDRQKASNRWVGEVRRVAERLNHLLVPLLTCATDVEVSVVLSSAP